MNWVDEISIKYSAPGIALQNKTTLDDIDRLIKALKIAVNALDVISYDDYYSISDSALSEIEEIGRKK